MPAGVGSRIGANGDYCRACIFLSSIPSYGNGALRVGLCVVANGHGVFSIGGGIQADANRGVGGNAHPGIGAQGYVVVACYFHTGAVTHGRVVVAFYRLACIGAVGDVVFVFARTVHPGLITRCQGAHAHGVGIVLSKTCIVLTEIANARVENAFDGLVGGIQLAAIDGICALFIHTSGRDVGDGAFGIWYAHANGRDGLWPGVGVGHTIDGA